MEPLGEKPTTPGVDAAAKLVGSFAADPQRADRYPDGTTFIASDLPDAHLSFARAIREKRPVAIVFPDGSDVIGRPPEGNAVAVLVVLAIAFLLAITADRRRSIRAEQGPLYFPRTWATEVHPAPQLDLVTG